MENNLSVAMNGGLCELLVIFSILGFFFSATQAAEIFLQWNVSLDWSIKPVSVNQPVITINGLFPGPLINSTTNDFIYVNVFNNLDEPLLMTWNGIQQRLNSWQDGVSGTNCPINPGKNWTYAFQVKDQIGSFFYSPSTNFQKASGGFGPIRVNNRNVILVPFAKPEVEFDLLIGDWHQISYKEARDLAGSNLSLPSYMLINGKAAYKNSWGGVHESLQVDQGRTYRLRISNVGTTLSFNFRIQNHDMVLVETEGSYTNQIVINSLDVHVGQSYSVLFTANQTEADYYMVATPTQIDTRASPSLTGVALLQYKNSNGKLFGPIPSGPAQLDSHFSVNQAKSIRWNLTTGAARPNPQGTFNVSKITISQTFELTAKKAIIDGVRYFTINNIAYQTPSTPLKLADYLANGTGVYVLDAFPLNSIVQSKPVIGTVVNSAGHKGWAEIIFKNNLDVMDAWHLDGFGFYVVGLGVGEWNSTSRESYNFVDPVVRSTVQVYPGGWSAIYVFLDNPGMWNLRSQRLQNWYMGQELYLRVHDNNPNPLKERSAPQNLLRCGVFA